MKSILSVMLCFTLFGHAWAQNVVERHSYVPVAGFVPDEQTAISVAVAVLSPIYGAQQIADEKPYSATLVNGVWTVVGSLPAGFRGGVALIEISKATGQVLRVSHGK
jgi:hypothetical protein